MIIFTHLDKTTSISIEYLSSPRNFKDKKFYDSKLVIRQIKEEYEAKEERMQKYLRLTKHLTQEFDKMEFVQIPRSQNMVVDEVAKIASSEEGTMSSMGLVMEIQKRLNIEEVPTFTI